MDNNLSTILSTISGTGPNMSLSNISQICRVCMKTEDGMTNCLNGKIAEQFRCCTQLEISDNDDLPNSLCRKCLEQLKAAYDFRKQAVTTDNYLRENITSFEEPRVLSTIKLEQDLSIQIEQQAENNQNNSFNNDNSIEEQSLDIKVVEFCDIKNETTHEREEIVNVFTIKEINNVNYAGPYECTICSTRFTQNGELELHLRMHSEIRPYRCDICTRDFIHHASLAHHMKYHAAKKRNNERHLCSICKKFFSSQGNLQKHMNRHTATRKEAQMLTLREGIHERGKI